MIPPSLPTYSPEVLFHQISEAVNDCAEGRVAYPILIERCNISPVRYESFCMLFSVVSAHPQLEANENLQSLQRVIVPFIKTEPFSAAEKELFSHYYSHLDLKNDSAKALRKLASLLREYNPVRAIELLEQADNVSPCNLKILQTLLDVLIHAGGHLERISELAEQIAVLR